MTISFELVVLVLMLILEQMSCFLQGDALKETLPVFTMVGMVQPQESGVTGISSTLAQPADDVFQNVTVGQCSQLCIAAPQPCVGFTWLPQRHIPEVG